MPLYQEQGEEGFFLIRKIPQWILKLSAGMRKLRLDSLLTLLPGISWATSRRNKLMVHIRVANLLSKPFFHLLGYRSRIVDKNHIMISNREHAPSNSDTTLKASTFWTRDARCISRASCGEKGENLSTTVGCST